MKLNLIGLVVAKKTKFKYIERTLILVTLAGRSKANLDLLNLFINIVLLC